MLNQEIIREIERKILSLKKGAEFQIGKFLKDAGVKGALNAFEYSTLIINQLKRQIGLPTNCESAVLNMPYNATFRRI